MGVKDKSGEERVARGLARLYTLILFFVPPFDLQDVKQVDRHRRAQILVTFCFLAGLTSLCVPTSLAVITGDFNPRRIAIAVVGLLLIINPLLMKATGRFEPIAYLFYVETGLLMGGQTVFLGGIEAPTLVIFLLWPLGAFFIIGRSLGVFTTSLVMVCISLFLMFPQTFKGLNFFPGTDTAIVLYACFCTVLVFSAIVSWTYETFQANFRTRTMDLLNRLTESQSELLEANRAAAAANEAKSEFLAHMSHEIRTPMNGVLGMAALLEDSELTADQREMAHTITTSSEALLKILNDILDLSKVEAGKLELDCQRFNLRSSLEDVLELVAPGALAKGVEVLLDYPQSTPEIVRGDESRVRQIITNLAGNAIKFTHQGEITLTVRHVSDAEGFEIAVADTGIGISETQQEKLFSSFQQANAQIAGRFGGTGLGLSISRQLARLMGGDLNIQSTPGLGSTFYCTLNLSVEQQQQANSSLIADGARALILTGNTATGDLLSRMLAPWGLQATIAHSTQSAEEALDGNAEVDAVLLDETFEALSEDRSPLPQQLRSRLAGIPLLMLLRPQASIVGARAHMHVVHKPLRAHSLYHALSKALGNAQIDAQAVNSNAKETETLAERWPLRILAADDNPVNRMVVGRMLNNLGYDATLVDQGQAAVDALVAESFDLVLMDIEMPVLNGLEATRIIRETLSPSRQPIIIALTAHAMAGDRERLLTAGMDDYLSKPLQRQALREVISRQAEAQSARRVEVG